MSQRNAVHVPDAAHQILADWREDYNTVRPHSQLDGRTPDQVARQASRGHVTVHKHVCPTWRRKPTKAVFQKPVKSKSIA
ncbi:hypothetical protein DmAi_17340 [Acetobacter persici]|uniref:Integrase catalytic domain-containing protein n=1 Tax=Acetobacter persici TaxID=1076596 RepID=A0A6V8IEC5_9PROT|nr:hypothetical protein DmAi_17340 [Acetobacter persici]